MGVPGWGRWMDAVRVDTGGAWDAAPAQRGISGGLDDGDGSGHLGISRQVPGWELAYQAGPGQLSRGMMSPFFWLA
ncbi:hypothetical protein SAMN02949497_1397 [Methylomagnum ishizawai]|uniref:Uncharacterized protein n=1 Tax=Methylomagnum ishizawai TaxID=1760988 RepID=A0A1Y6CV56_9GAMM|nr:hypothetical protein SAMN02949497_1397 [Methylomagnum ishizawai]